MAGLRVSGMATILSAQVKELTMEHVTFECTPESLVACGYMGVAYMIALAGIFSFKYNLGERLYGYMFCREWATEVKHAICAVTAILTFYYVLV